MRITNSLSPFLKLLLIPSKMMRKAYDWTIHWSKTKYAKLSLFLLAFAESSFFPIPPDVLLVAMTVAHRYKWWIFALLATAGSVLGGVFILAEVVIYRMMGKIKNAESSNNY